MKKKTIFDILALSAMAAGIAVGLFFLYKDAPRPERAKAPEEAVDSLTAAVSAQATEAPAAKPVEAASTQAPAAAAQAATMQPAAEHAAAAGTPSATPAGTQPAAEAPAKPTEAAVPGADGPFSVLNCATGKMNTLQRKDGALSLTDEKGAQLWSIPFPTPLCAMAGTIDYYANGRLQFLFISDGEIRLFDRKGKEVAEVRRKLDKAVRIGPAIYDFSKRKKYNILTLNTDGTIDMYNLQGKKPNGWKAITAPEPIASLPQYVERKGKSYWWLSCEKNCYLYTFLGGQPVKTFAAGTSPGDVTF